MTNVANIEALDNAKAGLTTDGETKHEGTKSTQRKIERDMAQATSDKFHAEIAEARANKTMDTTKPGRHIIAATVGDLAERITEDCNKVTRGKPRGARALFKKLDIDPEVAAYITIKTVVNMEPSDSDKQRASVTKVGARIAQDIHEDTQFKAFKAENKKAMAQLEKQWEQRGTSNIDTKKAQLRNKARHEAFGFEQLANTDAIQLGSYLLDIAASAGYATIHTGPNAKGQGGDPKYSVRQSDQMMSWMGDLEVRAELLQPRYWPMVVPPRHWIDGWSGGYLTQEIRRLSLVKHARRDQQDALADADLTQVTDSVNAMQDTPWQVNSQVLAVFQWALSKSEGIAGLPPAEDAPKPPKPADFDKRAEADPDDAEVKKWKRQAAIIHESNAKLRSKRIAAFGIQRMAEQFERFESIFFPYNLDFRGRAYTVPQHLDPQGSDHSKALLKFSKGERMGDNSEAEYWLSVHGANVYGNDKAVMDDRGKWAERNNDMILKIAGDPWGNVNDWENADKPWQFLAFCFEWEGYQEQGADFVATLPVAMDGSCNGLQHYSAAIRDQVGGEQVNLVPSNMPQDIYGTVAQGMATQLTEVEAPSVDSFPIDPDTGLVGPLDDEQATAYVTAQLKGFKIDRKLAKRTVMTVPYGVTEFGSYVQIEQGLTEAIAGQSSPFKHLHQWDDGKVSEHNGIWNAARVLAPLLMESIGEALAGAQECMDFVKDTVKVANDAKVDTTWTTPDGFPVAQKYRKRPAARVNTVIHGSAVQLSGHSESDERDTAKSKAAAPPNFVHSLDAAAMRMYVNRATTEGIEHFAMVHDSYGTLATKVVDMNRLIREAFVGMYGEHDVLAEFRDSIAKVVPTDVHSDLPPVPDKGTLDLDQVHQSVYFFS